MRDTKWSFSARSLPSNRSLKILSQNTRQIDPLHFHFVPPSRNTSNRQQDAIRSDAKFRQKFIEMCASLGVDPMSSNKTFSAKLGFGSFYTELGVQVVDVCMRTRSSNGGLIGLQDLTKRVIALRGANSGVETDDILRAVRSLQVKFRLLQAMPCRGITAPLTSMIPPDFSCSALASPSSTFLVPACSHRAHPPFHSPTLTPYQAPAWFHLFRENLSKTTRKVTRCRHSPH